MWQYIAFGLLSSLVAYIISILLKSDGSEYEDNSFDAFIDHDKASAKPEETKKVNKYEREYPHPGRQVLILYGTEYGFSQEVAQLLFDRLDDETKKDTSDSDLQPRIVNMKNFSCVDFSQEQVLLVVVSTAGDGVPPTDARSFYEHLDTEDPDLSHLYFSVLALGDSNYPHYCRAGRRLHNRLDALGGKLLSPRQDVDQEDWHSINQWMDSIQTALATVTIETRQDYLVVETSDSGWCRSRPFWAKLKVKYNLTRGEKETIHCEFDLTGSNLTWMSGDALAIIPENSPEDVQELLTVLSATGEELVATPTWAYQPITEDTVSLRTALTKYYDLHVIKPELMMKLAERIENNSELQAVIEGGTSKSNTRLHDYINQHFIADLLQEFPVQCSPMDILPHMKALQPRYYSISSSPVVDPNMACVTAAIVRYDNLGKQRGGVATTFLQDRLSVNQSCPVFLSHNPEFRLPESGDVPVILIGPGTGIAPFRAFIQERVAMGAKGFIHLYFGCRHKNEDFLYKEELESWHAKSYIKLQTAFSRDQPRKIYVQNLLLEDACELYASIAEHGAHVYICGDARFMARDVHRALAQVIAEQGHITLEEAESVLEDMEREGRFQKDVWVA